MSFFLPAYCLICHEMVQPKIGWSTLFCAEQEQFICSACNEKLKRIGGNRCRPCSRSLDLLAEKFRHGDTCHDCIRWEEDLEWKGYLDKSFSIFHYDEFLKAIMARFKYRGDYCLVKIFAQQMKPLMNDIKADVHIPIPLSDERLFERGFNQAEALITEAGYLSQQLLTRIHSEKQSKKSRTARIELPQVFQIDKDIDLKGKKILLMDDIYTTGSTLRHAAKLLKNRGAEKVLSITIAR